MKSENVAEIQLFVHTKLHGSINLFWFSQQVDLWYKINAKRKLWKQKEKNDTFNLVQLNGGHFYTAAFGKVKLHSHVFLEIC